MEKTLEEFDLPKHFWLHVLLIVGIIFIILLPKFCFTATEEDIERVREQIRQQEIDAKKKNY